MRPALTGWARMRRAAITRLLLTAALSSVSFLCHAEGTLLKVPTREGVTTTLFWEPAPNAKATVFLFPGGGGGFGKVEDGKAMGQNFLVRSEPYFIANGFNVAIFGRPSDSQDLDYVDRISDTHMCGPSLGYPHSLMATRNTVSSDLPATMATQASPQSVRLAWVTSLRAT